MAEEIDIWCAAKQMIDMFGSKAGYQSGRRAGALMDQGDVEGFEMWKRVAAAINELDRATPREGSQH